MLPFLSLFSFPVHSKDYPRQELTFDLPDMEPKCTINYRMPEFLPSGDGSPLLESPRLPMEFLSRSWSAPALEITKALAPQKPPLPSCMTPPNGTHSHTTSIPVPEEITSHSPLEEFSKNQFSFASSATSQLVLERIMSQSTREEMSSLTSGRLSHNNVPLIGGGSLTGIDSPPISPEAEFDDLVKFFRANYSIHLLFNGGGGRGGGAIRNSCTGQKGKTVGRWLKDRREKKKEENRIHNAQLHATISVASVAAAVAAITAATAASSTTNKDKKMAKIDVAVASAATLVAAQCVEAAEAMGAERDHLASVVGSAVNVRSHDDITTLTAAAATALRGATTLKARALKEVWNISSMTPPQEKGMGRGIKMCGKFNKSTTHSGEIVNGENFPYAYSEELLARGFELLKRTRNGDLHWKIVSAHIHHTGQVILKMKSKHVAGTITKKNKNVVVDVCADLAAWPGRNLVDDNGEIRRYFGLKTESRGIVEFECRNQTEYDIWTQGVSKLLSIGAQRKTKCANSTS